MNKSIAQIKTEFQQAERSGDGELEFLYEQYARDSRSGVQSLVRKYKKRQEALREERKRLDAMRSFERQYGQYSVICGIDEAGRGPLAGPVVAGAVILPKDCEILYLNDSKKLSAAKREMLYDEIMKKAVGVGVGMASPSRIDEINILQATYEAMREAVGKLGVIPGVLLNDAVTIPHVDIPQVPIIKGDAKSVSIAAASIIAKVTRDRLMVQYDKILPGYGFAQHKGYGSKEHIEALRRLGPSPVHRQSFIRNFVTEEAVEKQERNLRMIGMEYEKAAGRELEKKGYEILEYNYRCALGEIDLIAKEGEYLVFCEVKYRSGRSRGSALEAVDERKQKTISRCAMQYLTERGIMEVPCRFDVIGIEDGKMEHIKNAFTF